MVVGGDVMVHMGLDGVGESKRGRRVKVERKEGLTREIRLGRLLCWLSAQSRCPGSLRGRA